MMNYIVYFLMTSVAVSYSDRSFMLTTLKTRHILLHPNNVKLTYVKKDGTPLTDTSEPAMSYLFNVEFVGVDLNPLRVVKVIPHIMNYGKNSEAEVIVEYIDESVALAEFREKKEATEEKEQKEQEE